MDEAGEQRTDLLVLPELRFFDSPSALELLCDRAAAHRMLVVAGLRDRLEDGRHRASSVLIDRSGSLLASVAQTHAFADEKLELGDDIPVVETELGLVGMTMGNDRLFFEPYEVLARKGARIITWSGYPDPIREHLSEELLWRARAIDFNVTLAVAGYADDLPFFPQGYDHRVPGSPIGRSRVIDHGGVALADTGYDDGIATAELRQEKRKRRPEDPRTRRGLPSYGRPGEPLWLLQYFSPRRHFRPLATPPAVVPARPRGPRTVRVCVQSLLQSESWRNGVVPESLLAGIEATRAFRPDLVVCSEQSADLADPATEVGMARVAEAARSLGAWIVVAGIRPGTHPSTAFVWNRRGEVVFRSPINWTGEAQELRALETDFGTLGIRICGDTEFPEIDRVLALQGAELIVDPSQMWAPGGANLELMARARAIDNGVYVVCSHWTLSDPSLRSFIVDPYGMILAATRYGGNDVAFAELKLGLERRRYTGDPDGSLPPETDSYIECYTAERLAGYSEDYWSALFSSRRPELYGVIALEDDCSRSGPSEA